MSIKVTVKIQDAENRIISLEVEETMTFRDFMKNLLASNVIDPIKASYLETTTGVIYPPSAKFLEFPEREFNLKYGFPPDPPTFHQLGIFVIDGSGSMKQGQTKKGEEPSKAVGDAVKSVIERLKKSNKSNCFEIAVIAFGDSAVNVQQAEKVGAINTDQSFEPTDYFNGKMGSESTNISAGLKEAYYLTNSFLTNKKDSLSHTVSIIILTDGMCHHANETREIAATLREVKDVVLSSCHLETGITEPGAVSLLTEISDNYESVYDEETIRNFFIASTLRFPKG
jgi:uncharacterized protein YegL